MIEGRLNQWVEYIIILQQVAAIYCAIVNSKSSYECTPSLVKQIHTLTDISCNQLMFNFIDRHLFRYSRVILCPVFPLRYMLYVLMNALRHCFGVSPAVH